ncbi:MFS transporter, partial [Mycobacterium sp. ITM-2017-0098]
FFDRDRLATFAAMFLVRGVGFTLTVLIAVYAQNAMGYSPLRAGISFIPFAIAMTIGVVASSRMVTWFSPRA